VFTAVASLRYERMIAAVLGAVVFSHWLLDLPMHRADMPLLPANLGGLPLLGFGLWRMPAVSALLELVLVVLGAVLYARAASALGDPPRARRLAWALAAAGVFTLGLNLAGM
jgi:hypothetical protein